MTTQTSAAKDCYSQNQPQSKTIWQSTSAFVTSCRRWSKRLRVVWLVGLFVACNSTLLNAELSTTRATCSETLDWMKNDELPSSFKQFRVPRGDGSFGTAYIATKDDSLSDKRPLIVFVNGSGAQSHFFKVGEQIGASLFGVIAREMKGDFHLATIEKRGVDFADEVERPGSAIGASEEYQLNATLEGRVENTRALLDVLMEAPFVDSNKVILFGHSEGADVAAAVAAKDERVTHVVFLSGGGAPQFFDFFVMQRKSMEEQGNTSDEIESAMGKLEQKIAEIMQDSDSIDQFWQGHAYRRWASFATVSSAESLLQSKAKVFAAHGSNDASVPIESFDLLAAKLVAERSSDVKICRFPGRNHAFATEEDETGIDGFIEVMHQALDWCKTD